MLVWSINGVGRSPGHKVFCLCQKGEIVGLSGGVKLVFLSDRAEI